MDAGSQIVILIVLLVFSAFFSSTETAFNSINRVRLKSLAEDGDKKAQRVLKLSERYDILLATLLIGNNIVNIASASIAAVLFVNTFGTSVMVSTVVMTLVVLIFGEVAPKTIAKDRPEQIAKFAAPFMTLLVKVLFPVSKLFTWLNAGLIHLLPKKNAEDDVITEDELMNYVDEAEGGGGIDENESALIRSAIEFHDQEVNEILTPRVDIEAIEDTATTDEIAEMYDSTGYSRLPVYHESIDNIIGVLHERDFYSGMLKGDFKIENEIGNVIFVQAGMNISTLMHQLQQEKVHMAIVLDEFGGTLGLVTLEDVIEELVGEIWDEHDEVIEFFKEQSDGTVLVDASTNLDDVFEYFDWGEPDEEIDSVTVGGWAIEMLGCIPKTGAAFRFENATVAVTKADRRHVLELRVSRPQKMKLPAEEK